MDILNITFRTILVLFILFFLEKAVGKKQISQMNLFDYIIGITIGSIAADISLDIEKSLVGGIMSLSIYATFSILISYITMKSIVFRKLITGVPTILIEKGQIIEKGLKKSRLNINDLLMEARNSGYFNIEEIDYALMETNGKISFLPKLEGQAVTKKDMQINIKKQGLVKNVIIDSNILYKNLEDINKDEEWLIKQLKINGYNDISKIILATVDINLKLNVYVKK